MPQLCFQLQCRSTWCGRGFTCYSIAISVLLCSTRTGGCTCWMQPRRIGVIMKSTLHFVFTAHTAHAITILKCLKLWCHALHSVPYLKSGTARIAPKGKTVKQRSSWGRDEHRCYARIKVSRHVDGTAVTIERLDKHTHTHDTEESFRIKNQAYCWSIPSPKQSKIPLQPRFNMSFMEHNSGWESWWLILKKTRYVNLKRGMK